MSDSHNISLVLLSAGFSLRMQKPKFNLRFDSEKNFIEVISANYFEAGITNQIVVFNDENNLLFNKLKLNFPINLKVVINPHPEWERFYSVQCGLQQIPDTHKVLLQNIDNPFINSELIHRLIKNENKADLIKPIFKDRGGHPVLLSEKIIADLKQTNNPNRNLKEFLQKYSCYNLETNHPEIHININSPDIYRKYFQENPEIG